ncbi:uncharacterized protein LOC118435128 [Folsomia candida]|uniref:uncharacterized protein LOC118435128 n=1 Tax=Folsomia candida TaxID=158441 RepID=UPI001605382C|nr:uncharacterized protein LOC118435128 [Folsomia candida]
MDQMEFWKNDNSFQAFMKDKRTMPKNKILAILQDIDNTIINVAWQDEREDDDYDTEDDYATNDESTIYFMPWSNLDDIPADVVCLYTSSYDILTAANRHVSDEACTDRFLKWAGWTPGISNVISLCQCPYGKRNNFKCFARSMLGGGISTFTRSKEDILTRKDKNIVIQAILDNLEYLPNPTLYKMSNIEIWKKDENFQNVWKDIKNRIGEFRSILRNIQETLRTEAWKKVQNVSDDFNYV